MRSTASSPSPTRSATPSGSYVTATITPLNIIVSDDELAVIDWTDAGVGDCHGDIARTALLFDLAAIAAENKAESAVLRRVGPLLSRWYLDAYQAVEPIDQDRVNLWRPVHILHGWSQVRGLKAGLFSDDGEPSSDADRLPPDLDSELRDLFNTSISG